MHRVARSERCRSVRGGIGETEGSSSQQMAVCKHQSLCALSLPSFTSSAAEESPELTHEESKRRKETRVLRKHSRRSPDLTFKSKWTGRFLKACLREAQEHYTPESTMEIRRCVCSHLFQSHSGQWVLLEPDAGRGLTVGGAGSGSGSVCGITNLCHLSDFCNGAPQACMTSHSSAKCHSNSVIGCCLVNNHARRLEEARQRWN
ncbi:hypothetical protein SRHO_G00317970 [Serrasalmus rhombeus]